MTIAPAAATFGAYSRELVAPAENRAMSSPAKSAVAASSTTISPVPSTAAWRRRSGPRRRTHGSMRREGPLGEQGPHDAADLAGGAEHADGGVRGEGHDHEATGALRGGPNAFGAGAGRSPGPMGAQRTGSATMWVVLLSDRADEVAATPFGIYVHVPFCERRCGYCAFTTVAVGDPDSGDAADRIERYVSAAIAEIRTAAGSLAGTAPSLTSVFFGGGTPTMLSADQLGRVLGAVTDSFAVRDDLEVTVESNPDGLRPGQLAGLREAGVTRMSFGMQSIRRRVLELLDRTHDPERALAAAGEAREVGLRPRQPRSDLRHAG